MADYKNLPVFKACYDLLLRLFQLGNNWKRDIRYTLGEELKREVITIQQLVYQANSNHDKKKYIESARLSMVKIKLQIRILHDLKQITLQQYASLAQMTEDISKQLAAWNKYATQHTTTITS